MPTVPLQREKRQKGRNFLLRLATNIAKWCPKVWVKPLGHHFYLCTLQRCFCVRRALHRRIEFPHQADSVAVADIPKAHYEAPRPGSKKSAGKAEHFVAAGNFATAGLAGAESNKLGIEPHFGHIGRGHAPIGKLEA